MKKYLKLSLTVGTFGIIVLVVFILKVGFNIPPENNTAATILSNNIVKAPAPTPTECVYVVDNGNQRIQDLYSSGNFIVKWGTLGSGNGQFQSPVGIVHDSSGNIYVADIGNNRIEKFTSTGTYITQWGSSGSGNGQFNMPVGLAIDSSGNIYVVDELNSRIQKFSSAGIYLTQWGTQGSGNGQFYLPSQIAVDSSGNVYVADSGNSRIQKFTSTGSYLTQWGSSGSGNGQFYVVGSIAIDSSGNIYVAGNNRIQKFTSTGSYLTQWGSSGSGNGQFGGVVGVAVDSLGNVYAADAGNGRIEKFTSTGAYLTQWGSYGSGNGQFSNPLDLTISQCTLPDLIITDKISWTDKYNNSFPITNQNYGQLAVHQSATNPYVYFKATVQNAGTAPMVLNNTSFKLLRNGINYGGLSFGTGQLPIAPGTTQTIYFSTTYSPNIRATAGSAPITIVGDTGNVIIESNETNNTSPAIPFTVI